MTTDATDAATPGPLNDYLWTIPSEFSPQQAMRIRALRQAKVLLAGTGPFKPTRGAELLQVAIWITDGTLLPNDEQASFVDALDEHPSDPDDLE